MGNTKAMSKGDIGILSNPNAIQIDADYKKAKMQFSLMVAKLNTGRVQTPEAMKQRLDQVFDLCLETNMIPTYENLAVACGIPIRTFYEMQTGNNEKHAEFLPIIKNAKDLITSIENSMAIDGKIPSAVWIFRAKNYQGMRDTQQIEVQATTNADVPRETSDLVQALPDVPSDAEIIDKKTNE